MDNFGTPLQGIEIENAAGGPKNTSATQTFTIPPSSTSVWVVDSNGPVTAGWAVVSTASTSGGNGTAIGGTAIFELDVENSDQEDFVGVGAVGQSNQLVAPTVTSVSDNWRTGLAIGTVVPNTLTFTYTDEAGTNLYMTQRTLPANGHLSLFVDELFPGFALGSGGAFAIGTLRVTGTAPLAAIAIQFFGLEMTTFPVIRVN
jgi:hypothetical protein